MNEAERFRVRGTVQGVGFRAHTRQIAEAQGLSGWARNCSDGSVDILLYGDTQALAAAKALIMQGPPAGRVNDSEVLPLPEERPLTGFEIG